MHYPSNPSFKQFKNICVCCEQSNKKMNNEHYYPKWLLKKTKCEKVLIKTPYGYLPGNSCVAPLCEECNEELANKLETPVSEIFERITNNEGFNDFEAELLIRWLWKIKGIFYWAICNDKWKYGYTTLHDKVLNPIEQPRSRISIAASLIKDEFENDKYGYAPIGFDSFSMWSNVFISGVFSKLSIIIFYTHFRNLIDETIWTVYTLNDYPNMVNSDNNTYPLQTFLTGAEAIKATKKYAGINSELYDVHEELALRTKFKHKSQYF